ncbi:MAG: hypothetical protein AAB645_00915 [Patescibacteria group bacterium]
MAENIFRPETPEINSLDSIIKAEEGLIEKYPHREDLIRGLVAMLKVYGRPEPAGSPILETSN